MFSKELESPIIDLERHEWRRIVKWFYKGWPPITWPPFVALFQMACLFAGAMIAEFLFT